MHHLLKKQLARIGITEEMIPTLEQWKEIISRIDRTYTEADQDRYLIERSMEISSREMRQLTEKLEHAQHTAHLGYWQFDSATKKVTWSKEMHEIFGTQEENMIPAFEDLMNCLKPDDKIAIQDLMDSALRTGVAYDYQAKILTFDGKEKWCFISGKPKIIPGEKNITILTGIVHDITSRKNTELEIDQYQQFLTSARRAGMLEVAVSVLHNVGNILNSINVSIELLQNSFQHSEMKNVITVIQLLSENIDNLNVYLTEDKKGKLIGKYLLQAVPILNEWNNESIAEINSLKSNVAHLKDIVALQGTISGVSGVIEKISINDALDLAFNINNQSLNKYAISVEKNYSDNLTIETDKNKIIQILVNLIQNAKESLLQSSNTHSKKILLNIRLNNKHVEVEVADNGIGIKPENLNRIFTFGFTTKTSGHGFGLHSSSLLAKEIGGDLSVKSNGEEKGASFILRLPLEIHKKEEDVS